MADDPFVASLATHAGVLTQRGEWLRVLEGLRDELHSFIPGFVSFHGMPQRACGVPTERQHGFDHGRRDRVGM